MRELSKTICSYNWIKYKELQETKMGVIEAGDLLKLLLSPLGKHKAVATA